MDLASKKCVPCESGTSPMTRKEAEKYLKEVNGWQLADEQDKTKIRRRFKFDSYMAGVDFVSRVANLAEEEGHHPDIYLGYKRVTVRLMTHNIGGLSENDFVMAAKIDKLPIDA